LSLNSISSFILSQKDNKYLKKKIKKVKILRESFYSRKPDIVAKELLGKILVRKIDEKFLKGRIVESEAYFGEEDPASRAKKKFKKFYERMKGKVGIAFVYMVHANWLFNVVAHEKEKAGAVLIRAVEPLEGVDVMKENRKVDNILKLTNGPGKLCKAFGITGKDDGKNVTSKKSDIFIVDSKGSFEIESSRRIGVSRDLNRNLRFYIKGNKFVSKF